MVKGTSMDQELELEPEIVKLLTYVKEKKIVSWDELVDILGQDYEKKKKMETVLKILEENEVKVVMSEDSDDDDALDDEDALDDIFEEENLYFSSITLGELLFGAECSSRKSENADVYRGFCSELEEIKPDSFVTPFYLDAPYILM